MRRIILRSAALPAVLVACEAGGGARPVDWDRALDEVARAEMDFAVQASDSTVQQAFETWHAPDAIVFRPGPVLAAEALANQPFPPQLSLVWRPVYADVSRAGDLGWTTGPWHAGSRDAPGVVSGRGWYVTLWRATPEGWRWVLDFGTSNPGDGSEAPLELERATRPPDVAQSEQDPVAAREALTIADEDLNGAIVAEASAAYGPYAAADIRWHRDGITPARGIAGVPADSANWTTLGAEVAASGDLGYSWGGERSYDASGATIERYYLRIWRRDAEGGWVVVLDAASGPRPRSSPAN